MFGDELAHLVDGTNAVQIALALRVAPGEQAVAAENQAFRAWIVLYRALQHQSKLKPGPLPWKPRDLSSELPVELFELLFAVGAGRERDRPVGMEVVHMMEWQERV